MDDCILENLCELKETRDVIDNNVHNSIMNCIYGKKSVCIFKFQSFNEHDLSINVYSMNNIHYQCKMSNMKCIYAFMCDDIDGLRNYICYLLSRSRNKYNDAYTISRYDLKNIVNIVNENINLFRF